LRPVAKRAFFFATKQKHPKDSSLILVIGHRLL